MPKNTILFPEIKVQSSNGWCKLVILKKIIVCTTCTIISNCRLSFMYMYLQSTWKWQEINKVIGPHGGTFSKPTKNMVMVELCYLLTCLWDICTLALHGYSWTTMLQLSSAWQGLWINSSTLIGKWQVGLGLVSRKYLLE